MKLLGVMLVVLLVPAAVSAQDAESTWPVLAPPAGSTVYVRDSSGVETSGGLLPGALMNYTAARAVMTPVCDL